MTASKKKDEMNDALKDMLGLWRRRTSGKTAEERSPEENKALSELIDGRKVDWKGIFKEKAAGEIADQLDAMMRNES
jgi:hypothetical protein